MDRSARDIEELARLAIDCAFHLHRDLGPGLLESVYEALLAAEVERLGIAVDRQKPIDIHYRGLTLPNAFKIDLLLENTLLIELKSTERLAPVHGKQVLTYLRLMQLPLGLLINFGAATLKEGVKRVANNHRS